MARKEFLFLVVLVCLIAGGNALQITKATYEVFTMKDIKYGYSKLYELQDQSTYKCNGADNLETYFMVDDTILFVNFQFDQELSFAGEPFSKINFTDDNTWDRKKKDVFDAYSAAYESDFSYDFYWALSQNGYFTYKDEYYYTGRVFMATADPLFDFFTGFRYSDGTMSNNQLNFMVVMARNSDVIQWDIGFTVEQLQSNFTLYFDVITGVDNTYLNNTNFKWTKNSLKCDTSAMNAAFDKIHTLSGELNQHSGWANLDSYTESNAVGQLIAAFSVSNAARGCYQSLFSSNVWSNVTIVRPNSFECVEQLAYFYDSCVADYTPNWEYISEECWDYESEAYASNLYCSPCSESVCLAPTDQVVTLNRFEVDTSQCKHPTIVDNLISDYQFKESFSDNICDLYWEEESFNSAVFENCNDGLCAVPVFLPTPQLRKAYAAYYGQAEYDVDSLAALGEEVFASHVCAGVAEEQDNQADCEAYRGCNRDEVDSDVCDTSAGLLKNYCASPVYFDGGVHWDMDGTGLPICWGVDDTGICEAQGGVWDNSYGRCLLFGKTDISKMSFTQALKARAQDCIPANICPDIDVSNPQKDTTYSCGQRYYSNTTSYADCINYEGTYYNKTGYCISGSEFDGSSVYYQTSYYTGNVWTKDDCTAYWECADFENMNSYGPDYCANGTVVTEYCQYLDTQCVGTAGEGFCTYPGVGECPYQWDEFNMVCVNFTQTKKQCTGTWVESTNFCSRFGSLSVCADLDPGYGCELLLNNITTEAECLAKVSGECSYGGVYCRPKNFTDNNCDYPFGGSDWGCMWETLSPYACDYYGGDWADRTTREGCESDSLCFRDGTYDFFPGSFCDSCPDGRIQYGVFYPWNNPWYRQVVNKTVGVWTPINATAATGVWEIASYDYINFWFDMYEFYLSPEYYPDPVKTQNLYYCETSKLKEVVDYYQCDCVSKKSDCQISTPLFSVPIANASGWFYLSADAQVSLDVSPVTKDTNISISRTNALFLSNLNTKKEKFNGANKFTYSAGVADGTGSVVGYVLGDGYQVTATGSYNASLCIAIRSDFVNSNNYKTFDFAVGSDLTIMGSKCSYDWEPFFDTGYVCCTVTKSGLYYPIARSSQYNNGSNETTNSAGTIQVSVMAAIFAILMLLF